MRLALKSSIMMHLNKFLITLTFDRPWSWSCQLAQWLLTGSEAMKPQKTCEAERSASCSAHYHSLDAKPTLRAGGLGILGLLMLSGCASSDMAPDLGVSLQNIPVTALSASLSPGPGLAPGKSADLVIVAKTADGKELVTMGPGHGKVRLDSFAFESTVAQVSKEGEVSLPADPRASEGQLPHVRITVINHPDIVANLDIPVRYDDGFKADFSGQAGANGANGEDGTNGAAGLDNSAEGPGRNGQNGGPGGNGQNGGDGAPGRSVHVWLTLKTGSHPFLQARVANDVDEKLFLIDPNGGSLEVDANGGSGGKGGAGGKGGIGGTGYDNGNSADEQADQRTGYSKMNGSSSGFSANGQSGLPGIPGQPGRGGAAGTIIVSVDPQAQPFLDRLHLSNQSGDGVAGDAPEIRVEPVPAIW